MEEEIPNKNYMHIVIKKEKAIQKKRNIKIEFFFIYKYNFYKLHIRIIFIIIRCHLKMKLIKYHAIK